MQVKKGFTLTELLIVVSMISFLGVLVTAYLRTQVFKGYDAKRKADIKKISIAVEEYEKDNDCYPPVELVLCSGAGDGLKPYLNMIPCDPATNNSYLYENDGGSCSRWYRLYAKLDNNKDSDYIEGIGLNSEYSYVSTSPNSPDLSQNGTTNLGGGASNITGFVGCKSGVCVPVALNPTSGIPECSVNFSGSNCLLPCGTPQSPLNECVTQ